MKKNLFYNSLLSISQFIFPLVTFPFVSRTLGPNGIGSVNFIDSFTQYFLLFAALGIPTYGVREVAKVKHDKEKLSQIFSEIFIIHILATTIFSLIYIFSALFISRLSIHLNLVWIGLSIMYLRTATVEWLFVGVEEFAFITKRTLFVRVVSILLLFVLLIPFPNTVVYYITFAISYLLNGILNIYYARKLINLKLSGLNLKKHLKPLIVILSSSLAVSVYVLLDNIILGFLDGDQAVGFYSTAVRIIKIPFTFIAAIASVMIPRVSRSYNNGDITEVQQLLNKSFTFISIVGIPICIGLYVSSDFIIKTFAGPDFAGSIIPLQILTPVIVLVGVNSIFAAQLLTPIGKEKYTLISVACGMLFSLTLNFLIIPVFSYTGAAITNLATEVVVTIVSYYYANRFVKISFDIKIFLQCLFGAAMFVPIAFVIRKVEVNYIFKELMVMLACATAYIIYLWFFVKNLHILNIKALIFKKLSFVRNSKAQTNMTF